jgi:hypothetical protein
MFKIKNVSPAWRVLLSFQKNFMGFLLTFSCLLQLCEGPPPERVVFAER